jgi:hypothetical protein
MPDHVGSENLTSYADDTALWAVANNLDDLKSALETRAAAFTSYVAGCGLVLNAAKTQFIVSGTSTPTDYYVTVNGNQVSPTKELDLLGVRFDSDLSTKPQHKRLATAARQRASLIARLAHHLPRGPYLRLLAHGLVMGKIGYATSVIVRPRLDSDSPPHPPHLKSVQVSLNDVARSITGYKRTDHVKVADLLSKAGLPTLNQVAAKSMAAETWKAFHSRDGFNNERNALGRIMFGSNAYVNNSGASTSMNVRQTRSMTDGEVTIPLRGENTFTVHAASIWNENVMLREAGSKSEAFAIAKKLSHDVP